MHADLQGRAPDSCPVGRRAPTEFDGGVECPVSSLLLFRDWSPARSYSLYACGLTLTVSATGIYNLAFGAFAFVGGLTFFELSSGYMPRWAAFIVTVFVAAPAGGLFFEQFVFRKLARVPEVARLMGTIGILVGLPALAVEVVDVLTNDAHLGLASIDQAYSVPGIGPEPPHTFHFLKTGTLTSDQLIVLIVTAIAVGAIWLLMTRTRMGLMTRAVVDRSTLASTRGISPKYTSRVTWVLSSMLAALAGGWLAPSSACRWTRSWTSSSPGRPSSWWPASAPSRSP